jgi:hypothetical protein
MQHCISKRKTSSLDWTARGGRTFSLPLRSRKLWRGLRMGLFQAVIPNRARGRQSDMHKRGPALQFVMSAAVKEIGRTYRSAGAGCFNGAKSRVTVHDIIRKKDFLPAAPRVPARQSCSRREGRQGITVLPNRLFASSSLRSARPLFLSDYVLSQPGDFFPA